MSLLSGALPRFASGWRGQYANAMCWVIVLSSLYALKRFYSDASVDQLWWVLAPTAWLTGSLTGVRFEFERHVGYVSFEAATAIVPSCAGINYSVMLFGMLGTAFVSRFRGGLGKLAWLAIAAAISYSLTLLVNTARISLGMLVRSMESRLSPDQVHRIEGVLVYMGSLLLVYVAVNARLSRMGWT